MRPYYFKVGDEKSGCICTVYFNGKANILLVDSVFTKEELRNKGLATKIIEEVKEIAKSLSVDSIELLVNPDNIPAKRVYEKGGFEKTNKEHYRLILNKFK